MVRKIEYEIKFRPIIVKADNIEEADSKAVEEVMNGNLVIESIEEI